MVPHRTITDFCEHHNEPSNSEKQRVSDQLKKKAWRHPLISTVLSLVFHSKVFFFGEQGAEGNNLDLKGSKESQDKI